MGTPFVEIYNRFLGKITDDMYMELTPQDTLRDLRNLLVDAIPNFEFPRKNLTDYTMQTTTKSSSELLDTDFVVRQEDDSNTVEQSHFQE